MSTRSIFKAISGTGRSLDKIRIIKQDFLQYAKLNLKVLTKDSLVVPFSLNDAQKYVHNQVENQLSETGKIRAIILKGRQQGISTYIQGRFYWKCSMNFNLKSFVMAHQAKSSSALFAMAKRFHDLCSDFLRPSTSASNAKELIFDKLNSGYAVGTAGSGEVGRSMTFQLLHSSEVSFWDQADRLFSGLMQCVPSGEFSKGTEIFIESTANGLGGKFHEMWMEAINGNSEYIAIFIPWFWTSEYRSKLPHGFEVTDEEEKLKKRYKIDDNQIQWRREKIFEIGSKLFQQEYPFTWQEAFISTGTTRFEMDHMLDALDNTWKPISIKELEGDKFVNRNDGDLKIWEEPKQGERYVIGADTAEGIPGGDYSCAQVLHYPSGRQVASFHAHIPQDLFGDYLNHLGRYYNTALLLVESNFGLTVLIRLRDGVKGVIKPYPRIYAQRDLDNKSSGEKQERKMGFQTTRQSKPMILDIVSAALREGNHGIAEKELVNEMLTFVVFPDRSVGAQLGCHDDRVMAYAIARYGLGHLYS